MLGTFLGISGENKGSIVCGGELILHGFGLSKSSNVKGLQNILKPHR